jgi:hypothetical protein
MLQSTLFNKYQYLEYSVINPHAGPDPLRYKTARAQSNCYHGPEPPTKQDVAR